jgi:hypothetical protein
MCHGVAPAWGAPASPWQRPRQQHASCAAAIVTLLIAVGHCPSCVCL